MAYDTAKLVSSRPHVNWTYPLYLPWVFEELDKIQLVDIVLPTRHGPDIRRRCVTQPTEHQAILLAHLKLNLPSLPLTDGV